MVFSSVTFLMVFLPLMILIYISIYLLPVQRNITLGNIVLLLSSLFFYAWGEPKYVLLLIFSTVFNFVIGLRIQNRKDILIMGITVNLVLLIVFKYLNFLLENTPLSLILHSIFPTLHIPHISLPLGISFFTFQGISYLIDIYRKEVSPNKNIIDFSCYITMFPQLVAGPIVRYSSIAHELRYRGISIENFAAGASRFTMGLAKKLLIADTCGRVADAAFSIQGGDVSFITAWAGMLCYTIQIYFDFSGYSDMAIGLGKIFGFTFPENFNYPYISRSIKEFWRRWHMTLSFWFRDYLYIPLGGSRKGPVRTYLNLMIVFCLCGLWHGAEWTFLVWGAYHGLFLVLERIFPDIQSRLPNFVKHIYTLLVVMFGWVIFRASDYHQIIHFSRGLLGLNPIAPINNKVFIQLFSGDVYFALLFGIILSTPIYPFLKSTIIKYTNPNYQEVIYAPLGYTLVLALLFVCFMPLFGSTYNAFIYFRF